jgi:leucyl-tRNA synthetase
MEYQFGNIEEKWRRQWQSQQIYKVEIDHSKAKYYVLDMFPYPSGAGLHVGHPLGYIATDILSRYKRMKGFNVLHPIGFDAFGLPAEQYAIETGQHPAITTEQNIQRYKEQLENIGFCFDWDREVRTCDPKYYKWTQWIFMQLFNAWYNQKTDRAEAIETLTAIFEKEGNDNHSSHDDNQNTFTTEEWGNFDDKTKQKILLGYRLAYLAYAEVNWCPALGTVLANDEVKDGFSERGGHPVFKKRMRQWFLRITAYADRLLDGLNKIDWPESLKEMQRHWIGKSEGATLFFDVEDIYKKIQIFTTRPDTIFGATFMVLAPEHELVSQLTTPGQKKEIESYLDYVNKRSDIERQQEKSVTGAFTGAYAINPFTNERIPIWIAEYVLAGYGSGAIMAVPSDDNRDFAFAQKFDLPIVEIIDRSAFPNATREDKVGVLQNSGFLNGMYVVDAIQAILDEIVKRKIGFRQVNYKLRDAGFSRQRYWGEPFPVIYNDKLPYTVNEGELPVVLPDIESYKPTEQGEAPLARNKNWVDLGDGKTRETDTMPGYAGSSWYFLRYMDPHNDKRFAAKEALDYWQDVDFYIGGSEHSVGHLMYARFWHKFLYDMGLVPTFEPFKKLVNQGMIQGRSSIVYRINGTNTFISKGLIGDNDVTDLRVDIKLIENDVLDIDAFKNWREEYVDAEFILEAGKYHCGVEIEKMSKRWHNVVNPDDVINEYGADVFRMYEMFLGPLEVHKPWDTKGIDGVSKFIRKYWRLFFKNGEFYLSDEKPTHEELKILHKTIKKITEDIDRLSFNTAVSAFMVATNELTTLHCNKRAILEPLNRLLAPFAPFITEEIHALMGKASSIHLLDYPVFDEKYLVENSFEYPVSVNGKLRVKIEFPLDADKATIENEVVQNETVQKWLEGREPRKIIIVPGRIINIVV